MFSKKILIIIIAIVISLTIALIFFINISNNKKEALSLKETVEIGLSYIDDLEIPTDVKEIEEINNEKRDADTLYSKKNYTEAKPSYNELAKKISKILKEASDPLLRELENYGNSILEQQTLFNQANTAVEKNDYKSAFNSYKAFIEQSRSLIDNYNKEVAKSKPEIEENIAKEIITGSLNKDYKVTDIKLFVNATWAVATVQPITFKTDDAYIAFQYVNEQWVIVAGPGTYFISSEYPDIPKVVLDALNGGI